MHSCAPRLVVPVPNPYLAPTNPEDYRYAVHCCGYKLDLTYQPDRAVALFERQTAAFAYGRQMWPNTFEVIDRLTGEKL